MSSLRVGLLSMLTLLLVGCDASVAGSAIPPGSAAPGTPSSAATATAAPTSMPASTPTPAPSLPAPIAQPPALPPPATGQPSPVLVSFNSLPPGTYPVHLHRICNGTQGFHLAYLPDLSVGSSGSAEIAVPSSAFGRGWCLIVYTSRALRTVALYRSI